MSEVRKLVEDELRREKKGDTCIKLWNDIFSWYEEGGPSSIKEHVSKHVAEIAKSVRRGARDLKESYKRG